MIPVVTGAIGILVAFLIIFLVRKDRLHVQHGFGWIVVAAGFALLGFSPSVFDHIARQLGIAYPPILAVTIVIAVLVVKLLLMDIERSRIEVRSQRYIQKLAILEAELTLLKQARKQPDLPMKDQDLAPSRRTIDEQEPASTAAASQDLQIQ